MLCLYRTFPVQLQDQEKPSLGTLAKPDETLISSAVVVATQNTSISSWISSVPCGRRAIHELFTVLTWYTCNAEEANASHTVEPHLRLRASLSHILPKRTLVKLRRMASRRRRRRKMVVSQNGRLKCSRRTQLRTLLRFLKKQQKFSVSLA